MDKREELLKAGRWLREERERRGISVREFAAHMKVTTQVAYDWQNGKVSFNDERAQQIADLFNMDIIKVRRGLRLWVPPEPSSGEGVDQIDRLEQLWREYRDDPGERGTVLRGLLESWGDRDAG